MAPVAQIDFFKKINKLNGNNLGSQKVTEGLYHLNK